MVLNCPGTTSTARTNLGLAIGTQALKDNATGVRNVAIGALSFENNTVSDGVAVGYQAARRNTTGLYNVAVGAYSLYENTTGERNVAVGQAALEKSTAGNG